MAEETNYNSGAKITKQVLQSGEQAAVDNTLARTTDLFGVGVMRNLFNEFVLVAGSNSTSGAPSVTVQTGVAYNALGERIIISEADVPYDASKPSLTTPNGIGGDTLTPQSTGSANVPLPTNTNRFVWVDYVQTIDPNLFTLHKITGEKLFYSEGDGYQVGLSTSSVSVPGGFSVNSILLGVVTTDSSLTGGIALIDQQLMPEFSTQAFRVAATTPGVTTAIYGADQQVYFDDHIRAIGSGTITPTNPHALTGKDIGITDPGGVEHQKFLHTEGIESPYISSNSSALYMQAFSSGIAAENYVQIAPLTANELTVVDGITIDSSNIPSTLQFSFIDTNSNPLPDGVYTFYLDSDTKSVQQSTADTFDTGNTALMRIWDVQWINPTLDLTSVHDYRLFGNTGASNVRFELLGALSTGLATGNRTLTFSYNIDGNIDQIGVGGDNGTIAGAITLLTFSYDMDDNITQIGSNYGHKQLLTTLGYSGGTLTSVTEQVL